VLVDWPGASQSQLCIGGLGISNNDEAKPVANLVGSYFGGTFGSRLMKAIRVQEGGTYGVSGGFEANRFAGAFLVRTFTKTSRTAETVRMVLTEISHLIERGPTAQELSLHKHYFIGSAPARFETSEQIAAHFTHLALSGLPLDYLQRSLAKIEGTTAEECQAFARKVIEPEHLLIVVVGDASVIAKDLAGIAPVTVLDTNGDAVSPK
jgi:zinc protease